MNEFKTVCSVASDGPDLEVSLNSTIYPTEDPDQANKENWTSKQYGRMLGAFYYGYCAAMIPGAIFSQRFGFYRTITFVAFVNGISTILYPMAVHFSYKLGMFLITSYFVKIIKNL